MPSWLMTIVMKLIAQEITPDNVKGLEAELVAIVDKALVGYPDAVAIVDKVAAAVGLTKTS